ncbi:hypothetical protein Cgig2_016819 [Carnegiea gigantea]|uniref:Uncharacterized protein n=1 Tax=Carnegiea gigantea TaxID=171969 RepID=A0A9Q1JIJ2_9CARY|nr:hypothetical protein Cgig2_016819 [Carnegiea gigantea]
MLEVGGNSRYLLSDDCESCKPLFSSSLGIIAASDEEKCPYHPLRQQYQDLQFQVFSSSHDEFKDFDLTEKDSNYAAPISLLLYFTMLSWAEQFVMGSYACGKYDICDTHVEKDLLAVPENFSDDIDAISSCLGQEPFTAHESDDGEDDFMETDDDLLNWKRIQRIPWHLLDDPDWRDVYRVVVDTDKYVEDECRHMLRQIDCETRFICCSSFFALLKPGEAEQLRGVKGIVATHLHRKEFRPC